MAEIFRMTKKSWFRSPDYGLDNKLSVTEALSDDFAALWSAQAQQSASVGQRAGLYRGPARRALGLG